MIEPTEVRIGNWLYYKGCLVQWSLEDYAECGGNIEFLIDPIELTEEWLLKFGLKKGADWGTGHDILTWTFDGYLDFGVAKKGNLVYLSLDDGKRSQNINFVHQLQNLFFALTGKELTIKEEALNISNEDYQDKVKGG